VGLDSIIEVVILAEESLEFDYAGYRLRFVVKKIGLDHIHELYIDELKVQDRLCRLNERKKRTFKITLDKQLISIKLKRQANGEWTHTIESLGPSFEKSAIDKIERYTFEHKGQNFAFLSGIPGRFCHQFNMNGVLLKRQRAFLRQHEKLKFRVGINGKQTVFTLRPVKQADGSWWWEHEAKDTNRSMKTGKATSNYFLKTLIFRLVSGLIFVAIALVAIYVI
jgi:hypothetical protein